MARVIIGIHGLGNKPPEWILRDWWLQSIREGLVHIGHPGIFFQFHLVYWADVFHPIPLDVRETDHKNPKYIEFPYVPAIEYQEKPPRKWRRKVLDFLESKLDKIFLKKTMATSFNSVSDLVIRHYFKDLDDYYSATIPAESGEAVPAKEVIRKRLYDVLYKFRNKKILLLAHSMGTIIAYEVLMENQQKIFIDTFVTFGSPLGQPIILRKFYEELQKNLDLDHKPVVPDNIQSNWFNLSDLEDHIALNYNLNDDFEESSRKISVSDKVVYNNYVYERKRNPHKSYGYLRTPEMAEIIYQFLSRDRSRFTLWMESRWNEVMDKLWARGKR